MEFIGEDGRIKNVKWCKVDEKRRKIEGKELLIKEDMELIEIGFEGNVEESVVKEMEGKIEIEKERSG